jgi:multicomponent Na+:H+ antiporter subunit C
MSEAVIYGMLASGLVAVGLFGLIRHSTAIRRLLSFNLVGAGAFLMFGVAARRGAGAGLGADPVPQAIVITGLVVAFAATALAVGLILRIAALDRESADRGDDT